LGDQQGRQQKKKKEEGKKREVPVNEEEIRNLDPQAVTERTQAGKQTHRKKKSVNQEKPNANGGEERL